MIHRIPYREGFMLSMTGLLSGKCCRHSEFPDRLERKNPGLRFADVSPHVRGMDGASFHRGYVLLAGKCLGFRLSVCQEAAQEETAVEQGKIFVLDPTPAALRCAHAVWQYQHAVQPSSGHSTRTGREDATQNKKAVAHAPWIVMLCCAWLKASPFGSANILCRGKSGSLSVPSRHKLPGCDSWRHQTPEPPIPPSTHSENPCWCL